jgi:hypothetical protein
MLYITGTVLGPFNGYYIGITGKTDGSGINSTTKLVVIVHIDVDAAAPDTNM